MEKTPLEFYNNFVERLLADYLLANLRTEQAISEGLKMIDFSRKNVLDIGCGIGWSSFEFSKRANYVLGIDLSDNLIQLAAGLFKKENLKFEKVDVTKTDLQLKGRFDIVSLLDVFEHIPLAERQKFTRSVNQVLEPSGLVYLTCPSLYHQNWLREQKPEGLQPVDEDVDIQALSDFASELNNGDVVYFAYQSVWRNNDYFHAILQKGPVSFSFSNSGSILERLSSRFQRIKGYNKRHSLFSEEKMKELERKNRHIQQERIKRKIKSLFQIQQ